MIWKKNKKRQKVYWNEVAGQIVTKGGKCLYDKNAVDEFNRQVEINNCAIDDGHRFVFEKYIASGYSWEWGQYPAWYFFKCSKCNYEIKKQEKELTSTEKEALTKLKLL